jgi:hypothetical protein
VLGERVDGTTGYGDGCLRRGERDAWAQFARPQPLGDLFVGVARGQFGRVDPSEVVPVLVDQGDPGAYGELAGGR